MEGYRIGLMIAVTAILALGFVSGAIPPHVLATGMAGAGVLGGLLIHGLVRASRLEGKSRMALALLTVLATLAAGLGFASNITEWNPVALKTFAQVGDSVELSPSPSGRVRVDVLTDSIPTTTTTVEATFLIQQEGLPPYEFLVQFLYAGSAPPKKTTYRPAISTNQLSKIRPLPNLATEGTMTLKSILPESGFSVKGTLTTFPISRDLCLAALLLLAFLIALMEARGDGYPSLTISCLTALLVISLTQNGLVGDEAVQLFCGGVLIALIPASVVGTLSVAGMSRLMRGRSTHSNA